MTDPNRGKDSEQLLAEALRARAGGTPSVGRPKGAGRNPGTNPSATSTGPGRAVAPRPTLTLLQLILASLIAGLVVGILAAVLSLL